MTTQSESFSERTNYRRIVRVLTASLGLLLFCVPGYSQLNLGRILGAITDQSGGVIIGASVTVTDVERGISRPLTTDTAGEYSAPSLLPGTYTVRAEAKGFRSVDRQNVVLGVGQDIRVDLTLEPGEQTQTITVTEALPIINTMNAELGGTLTNQALNELPISGRLYTKLLDYSPGMAGKPGGNTPTYASNGQRTEAQVWMLDGVDDMNPYAGSGPLVGANTSVDEITVLPLDAIQEVNVIENPQAEFGWRTGAVVNVGLKSGSNAIHGTAYAFGRDTAMDAQNPFLGPSKPKATDQYEQFGASIGGPIKKDKLFYFTNFEGLRFVIGSPTVYQMPSSIAGGGTGNSLPDAIAGINAKHALGVPGATLSPLSLALAGCTAAAVCDATKGVFTNGSASVSVPASFNNVGGSNNEIGKVDYHVNDHNALNGEYFFGQGTSDTASGPQAYWVQHNFNRVQAARGVWVWTPNSTWVNEARFGLDRYHLINAPAECTQNLGQPNYATAFGFVSGAAAPAGQCGFPLLTISGFTALSSASGTGTGAEHVYTVFSGLDSVSYTRGKHLFKFGGEMHFTKVGGPGTLLSSDGTLNFGSVNAFSGATALQDFLAGVPASGTIFVGNPIRNISTQRYAVFGQDDLRVTHRLTVNLGVRYEAITPITDANNLLGNFDPTSPTGMVQASSTNHEVYRGDYNNWSPRVGLAWDVTGKGTTVVHAGASVVYAMPDLVDICCSKIAVNAVPTGFGLLAANGTTLPSPGDIQLGTLSLTSGQIPWAVNTPVFNTAPSNLICGNGLTSTTILGVPNQFPAPCNIAVVNPNLKLGYVTTWTLGVQHALTNNLSMNISYVGNHGTHLGGVIDINQPSPGQTNGKGAAGAAATELEQTRRPYYTKFPYLGQIRYYSGDLESNYNALQAALTERVTRGLSFSAGYAFAHSYSESDDENNPFVMNSANPQEDYGYTGTTPFHHFTLTATYVVPGRKSPAQILEGWQINSAVNLFGAVHWNAADKSTDITGTGESLLNPTGDRWTLVGTANDFKGAGGIAPIPCFGAPGSRFASLGCSTTVPAACTTAAAAEPTNPTVVAAGDPRATGSLALASLGCYMEGNSVIVPPAQGTFGTMARDALLDRPFREWDFSVTKNWKFKERLTAQFRAEFFNVLNAVEYSSPSSNPNTPTTFGQSQSTPNSSNPINGTGGARQVQLGLKLIF